MNEFEIFIIVIGYNMILISIYELYNMIKDNDPELDNYFDED